MSRPASASKATACSEPAARLAVEPSRKPSCTRETRTDVSVAAVGVGLRTGAGAPGVGTTGAGTAAAGTTGAGAVGAGMGGAGMVGTDMAGAGTAGAGTAAAGTTRWRRALGIEVTAAPSA